jgi:hypothetical protein
MRHCHAIWLSIGVLAAPLALAQDESEPDELGGGRLRASVSALGFYSDNFYNQPSAQADAFGALLAPSATYLKQSAKLEFAADGELAYGMFDLPGSHDDYLDGALGLRLASQPTLRNHFRVNGGFKRGHDPFGVNRTEDATARDDELDEWHRTTGGLRWRYGAPGARMNAEVGASVLEQKYTTNRTVTEPLSYDSTRVDYALFYNYSEKTSALLDFSREDFSFERSFDATGLDLRGGELYRVRTGARWLATGKTSGDVRVGFRRRSFDAGTPEVEGVDWEAGVDWAPVPRSTLRLETARSEQESYTVDARIIDIESISLNWKHNLTSRTRTTVRLERITADFDTSGGSDEIRRSDEILGLTAGAEHLATSYLWLIGSIGYTTRDSNIAAREYDRIDARFGVRLGR